ncbi:HNH endonuclease [Vibrio phage K406]
MARGGFRGNRNQRKRTAPNNIADEFERNKHEQELVKLLKRLHEDGTPLKPASEAQIMSIVRGAIREKWSFCDTKLAYLNMKTIPDDDPKTRRRWKVQCEHCLQYFKKTDVAVDHKIGGHSLKTPEELFDFYNKIINIGFDDLQVLCHEDHDRKTACDLYGYTWEEAGIFKQVTAWESANKKVGDQKTLLKSYGFSDDEISNKEKRRECIWKHIESLN